MLPHPPHPPWELLANWHVKSRETRYVRPSQSMVVLQLLVWLCRPMREWQSLPHMGKMRLKEGKVELFLRRTRFSSAFWWRFTFAFSFLLSLSVSSEHDQSQIFPVIWINFACFEVMFPSVFEPQGGAPDFPDSCYWLSVYNFLGDVPIIHAMNRSQPSQAALTEEGVHAGETSTWQYLTVGDVVLPLDAEDVQKHSRWKEFKRRSCLM